MDKIRLEVEERIALNKKIVQNLLDEGNLFDDDGYPTHDTLTIIELWHWNDIKGWFDFIHSMWHLASWGWTEGEVVSQFYQDEWKHQYDVSTAGWSGNESIIRAMEKNDMLWALTWEQSRRGGHYIFQRDIEE